MARPRKTDLPDMAAPCNLTAGVIERLACPPGKDQAFLRDADGNGLRVRVSPAGAKTFVFEQRLKGKTIRRAIGDVRAWVIEDARAEARRYPSCWTLAPTRASLSASKPKPPRPPLPIRPRRKLPPLLSAPPPP